ncbi:TRAP transporter small permease [Gemmobacter caeruleus]|uniref:TRAP transporter small permease n=1 Tax=Gemmobacter caeruleus TaxID=2595004 RepID=UPI0011F06385|nr:TRAP transporter small permease [Gemmobacter caeruleus]
MHPFWRHLDKLESYICQVLLAAFVCLLFIQIVSRSVFGNSITWIEELSVFMFVWFAYFGASYAARMYAHNRVSFHVNRLPRRVARWVEAAGDLFWVGFNLVFVWYAIEYLGLLKPFVRAQTLGWPMRYVMLVLPIAFGLMTLRILQVNYMKLVLGIDPRDPDQVDLDAIAADAAKAGAA